MDINKIYTTIFPIGGIDDNNRYANLTGDQISTVQLVEPSLGVVPFILPRKDRNDKNFYPDKIAYRIPLVSIDSLQIRQTNLTAFKLDYNGFVPTVMVEFVDTSNDMLSTNVIKDGSIIKVYIGGNGDELYYKPIRQDFVITNIKKTGGGNQNQGDYIRYRVYGKLNAPYGYRKGAWCDGDATAMQTLFNLAIYTGLGFATNFTKTNTPDCMSWRNNENGTYFDFMEDVTSHACYSPNTFFTSFIDQYNVLNFIECHSLLSHGGLKTDVPAMIYNNYPQVDGDNMYTNGDEFSRNNHQKSSYYYISNNDFFDGWSNYIEEYTEINNGYSSLSDGYKSHITYSDSNTGGWGFTNCEFIITPIDNLERESSTQKIKSIPEEPYQQSYIPLNLMHMTKKDYVNGDNISVDDMTNVESFTSFGEVDTSNMFKQYFFAEVQNRYQLKCMKKCGLKVILQNYNPSITKYSRIWVDIYDKNMMSNQQISPSPINEMDNSDYKLYKDKLNSNILKFDDEGLIDVIKKNKNWPRGEYNRGLSGWYVVTEMEIYYNPDDNNLKMKLMLNRIEYQPCFVSEYKIAQKAIEKYKEDNIIENLIISKDDYSYLNK